MSREPRPVFAGATIDRVGEHRHDPDWVAARLRDPAALAVLGGEDGVLVAGQRLLRMPVAQTGAEPWLLLGLQDGVPVLGIEAGEAPGGRLVGLREAGSSLPPAEAGLAALLAGLLNWHRGTRFCPRDGAPTELGEGGWMRTCTRCGTHHFPRTDPAVIMLVSDGERVLLGRRPAWPEGRFSVLAGFVSPGESLEDAVVREVWEEAGVRAREPRFVASQPWPFPASLMLGFTARAEADAGEPHPRDGELAEVRWFTRREVVRALDGEGPVEMPSSISIAHDLIAGWVAVVA